MVAGQFERHESVRTLTVGVVLLLGLLLTAAGVRADEAAVAPEAVKSLCGQSRERKFVADDGFQAVFRGRAASALRCEGGSVWKVDEGALPEGGTFYFDGEGEFLDMCQLLFRPSGCDRFKEVECGAVNYCRHRPTDG